MEINELEGSADITRFLEKFTPENQTADFAFPAVAAADVKQAAAVQEQYNQSFEKLEEKIKELEEKFAASTAQNKAVMQELMRTRQAVEKQKSKEAFFTNIAATIENLKQSVENLSHMRQAEPAYISSSVSRVFDAPVTRAAGGDYLARAYDQLETYRTVQQANLQDALQQKDQAVAAWKAAAAEKEQAVLQGQAARAENEKLQTSLQAQQIQNEQLLSENTAHILQLEQTQAAAAQKELLLSSLRQKTSQLKAVNIVLDREIKRAQQERTEALRKSADQAKEILSLRDALTAAEERFRSFDFKGRIISVKRHYERKVNKLETQLHEISNTCMKQVEEIESLKNENLKLQQIAEEREQLAALYEAKTRQLEALQTAMAQLQAKQDPQRLAQLTQQMQQLQAEHEGLAQRLTQAQQALQAVRQEKQTLAQNFKALLIKIKKNDEVIEALKEKIAVLTEENQELRKEKSTAPAAPAALKKEPVAVSRPVKPQAAAGEQSAAKRPVSAPVQMQNTLHTQVKTEADLPEIKVAEPIPQPEVELGDDFLEKTDSFIGRMKWSIFREDK